MNKQTNTIQRQTRISKLLLTLTLCTLFLIPLFPVVWLNRLYGLFFSLIFLCAAFSVRGQRSVLFRIALAIACTTALSSFADEGILKSIIRILQLIFFVLLVVALIQQIAASENVSALVIMDAVTAYLLLGFAFGIMVLLSNNLAKDAYSDTLFIQSGSAMVPDIRNAMYYTFATFTTTGYGDITPRHPLTKSLSTLISISGQLYVAIIISLLVGKFISKRKEST